MILKKLYLFQIFFLLNVEFYLVFYKEKILNYCIDMKVCNDRVKILKLIGELFNMQNVELEIQLYVFYYCKVW